MGGGESGHEDGRTIFMSGQKQRGPPPCLSTPPALLLLQRNPLNLTSLLIDCKVISAVAAPQPGGGGCCGWHAPCRNCNSPSQTAWIPVGVQFENLAHQPTGICWKSVILFAVHEDTCTLLHQNLKVIVGAPSLFTKCLSG